MADSSVQFAKFLSDITPTAGQHSELAEGQRILREQLVGDTHLGKIIEQVFIQGSYARRTAIRPSNGKRSDVDVVVVTKLDEREFTVTQARTLFIPFLEKFYRGKYRPQGRSFAIERTNIDLDLVLTSAPSIATAGIYRNIEIAEAAFRSTTSSDSNQFFASLAKSAGVSRLDSYANLAAWKPLPLRIPDVDSKNWESTHPVEQLAWTRRKNDSTNGHYINVVKAIKWWQRHRTTGLERPRGYPLEALVGANCPDGIVSVAEGVTRTLESMTSTYAATAARKETPHLADHGGTQRNVLARIQGASFALFHAHAVAAARIARQALDASETTGAQLWTNLFGTSF